jgi:hypothetical protein
MLEVILENGEQIIAICSEQDEGQHKYFKLVVLKR